METKLTLVIAVLALFAASVDAGMSVVTCEPLAPVDGQTVVCTCSASAGVTDKATKVTTWVVGTAAPDASTLSGDQKIKYTTVVATADTAKAIKCTYKPPTEETEGTGAIGTVSALVKPTIKCDPAKVAKDKESTCTCTSGNKGDPKKVQFSTDAGTTYKDATEGTPMNAMKVKITKDEKVNCKVTYGDASSPKYSPPSDDAMITLDTAAGGGSGSGSGAPGLPLAAMLFAFIATLFLRV